MARMPRRALLTSLLAAAATALPTTSSSQTALAGESIHVGRLTGPITIDGNLSDEAGNVTRFTAGTSAARRQHDPGVRNVGCLAYDDHFLYAAFEFDDPNPSAIRAPYSDRDDVGVGYNDFGGILVDARNTVTPRSSSSSHLETFSPIRSPTMRPAKTRRRTSSGTRRRASRTRLDARNAHTLFVSSVSAVDPQTWRILLYRNYPRDRNYQFLTPPDCRAGSIASCATPTC